MRKRIEYGVADYEELVRDHGYFVDKTHYIEKLEHIKNPIFLRPKRFGKSLFCRILECYYNARQKDQFEELFGHTYIGRNPTPFRNRCMVLHFDFSTVDPSGTLADIEKSFNHECNIRMKAVAGRYKAWFQTPLDIDATSSAQASLSMILGAVQEQGIPPLYIIIDEYDNFANQLIVSHRDHLYQALMGDDQFLKAFFKTMKQGRKAGDILNVFITGVLPMAIDDLASGFNIVTFLTLNPDFEDMLGFTGREVAELLDAVYQDYELPPSTRPEVETLIKNQYNGYRFTSDQGETLYNSTILLYFLRQLCDLGHIPRYLTDMNLKTDLSWVKRLTASNPEKTERFVDQLTLHNRIAYDDDLLTDRFSASQFFEESFFPISFFYLGLLTRHDEFDLKLPNMNMHKIFVEYFNALHRVNVSLGYTDIMRRFVKDLDLRALFAGYWERYVSQLPEAIFQQVNENFYRTTFFELCSRYLSHWFTWNVERSYPKGRSDLEFVGKFHEQFAGLRMVIEFKYYSNAEFTRLGTTLDDFQLHDEDTGQIAGYVEGLRQEYPEARISQHVIYCIGNQGFRVFDIAPMPAK